VTPTPPLRRFASRKSWESRRQELLHLLRSKVLARVPEKPRRVRLEERSKPKDLPARFHGESELSSDDTAPVRVLLRHAAKAGGRQPGLLYVASDGEDPQAIDDLLRGVRVPYDWASMVVFPRGVGEIPWNKTFWRRTLRNAMVAGESVDSMRLADIIVALEALRSQENVDPGQIVILGKGISGALGLYAAILVQRIQQVMMIDPPATHVEGPIFLNILRYTDLPEAAALIAPRSLKFYMRLPEAYNYTRHIYQLYGMPDRLSRVVKVAAEPQ